jgi:hypothetical protein
MLSAHHTLLVVAYRYPKSSYYTHFATVRCSSSVTTQCQDMAISRNGCTVRRSIHVDMQLCMSHRTRTIRQHDPNNAALERGRSAYLEVAKIAETLGRCTCTIANLLKGYDTRLKADVVTQMTLASCSADMVEWFCSIAPQSTYPLFDQGAKGCATAKPRQAQRRLGSPPVHMNHSFISATQDFHKPDQMTLCLIFLQSRRETSA